MTPARLLTAVLIAIVSTAVGWVGLDTWTRSGHNPPPMGWAAVAGTVTLVVLLLGAGLQVRRWIHGQNPRRVDALTAARIAVLAKAGVYGGAILTGWYLSQALVTYPDLVGVRRTRFIVALIAAGSAVVLSAVGFLVQRWCRVPPRDDDGTSNGEDLHRDPVP